MAVLDAELRAEQRSFADFLGVHARPHPERRQRRHPPDRRRPAGHRRRLPRRRLRAHQAEDRARLRHRAGRRRPRPDRARRAAAGRRQRRLHPPRRRAPRPARRLRPPAHRAAAARGRPRSATPSWPGRSARRCASTSRSRPRRSAPTPSSSGRPRSSTSRPAGSAATSTARRIHDLCRERGIPVWCGGMLETGIGRAANAALAALDGFTLPGDVSASRRFWATDIVTEPIEVVDGHVAVPTGAGLRHRPSTTTCSIGSPRRRRRSPVRRLSYIPAHATPLPVRTSGWPRRRPSAPATPARPPRSPRS